MSNSEENRIKHEIAHGEKISGDAESVWNWSSPAGQVRAQRRAELLARNAEIKQGDKVLEIGCGTGLFTRKIFDLTGAEITAIDVSKPLLDQAAELLPEAEFRIDDAMNLSFDDNSFDVVFGSSVLHHLDFEKSLREIHRVLKPGGMLAFAEPNMLNPQIMVQKNIPYIKEKLGDSPDETAIVRWSFAKLLRRYGFSDVRIFPYDFLHPITPKAMIGIVNGVGKLIEQIPVLREIAGSVIISARKNGKDPA